MNKNIFRNLSYGIYIISAMDGDKPTGCTANSAMQITSAPATIAVSINHDNYTNSCISKTGYFSISILSEKSDSSLIGTFGFQSGKDTNKFKETAYEMKEGLPVITDSCGYICCKVINTLETETHTIFLGEVTEGDVFKKEDAMTYAYYHKVVKGKSPKNAPTYLPEDEIKGTDSCVKHVCSVCGYVYDGSVPFEQLGEDFVCPICKVAKNKFERVTTC